MRITAPAMSRSDRQAPHAPNTRLAKAGWRIRTLGALMAITAGLGAASGLIDPILLDLPGDAALHRMAGLGTAALGLVVLAASFLPGTAAPRSDAQRKSDPLPEADSPEERALRAQILRDLSAITAREREMPCIPEGAEWASLVKPAANTPEPLPHLRLGPATRDVGEGTANTGALAWPSVCPSEAPAHRYNAAAERGRPRPR
ncbi:MAG: hypothetical protein AAFY59_01455 [Pseudomonadota bacterium]